eukprot:gene2355-2108_t
MCHMHLSDKHLKWGEKGGNGYTKKQTVGTTRRWRGAGNLVLEQLYDLQGPTSQ